MSPRIMFLTLSSGHPTARRLFMYFTYSGDSTSFHPNFFCVNTAVSATFVLSTTAPGAFVTAFRAAVTLVAAGAFVVGETTRLVTLVALEKSALTTFGWLLL